MRDLSDYLLAPVKSRRRHPKSGSAALLLTVRPSRELCKQQQTAIQSTKRLTLLEKIPAVTYVLKVGEFLPPFTAARSRGYAGLRAIRLYVFEKDPAHWIKVLHPEDRERILAEDARAGSRGEPFDA
jgi:hypothetical protein